MADALVNVVFQADTSQMTAAFAKVNSELSSVASSGGTSAMSAWRKETGLAEQATIDVNRRLLTLGGTVGKTAADFKPATAAMRQASVAGGELSGATERATSSFDGMVNRMATRLLIFGAISEALRGIGAAAKESMSFETAQVQFANLSNNRGTVGQDWSKLRSISTQTSIPTPELAKASLDLQKSGESSHDAGAELVNLAKYADISGQSVESLAAKMGKLKWEHGTIEDAAELAQLTGDSGKAVSDEIVSYRERGFVLDHAVEAQKEITRQSALTAEQQQIIDEHINRAAAATDRQRSAVLSVGEAIKSVQKQGYAQFMAQASGGGGAVAGGTDPISKLAKPVSAELQTGLHQVMAETGVDVTKIGLKAEEVSSILFAGAQRYHAEASREREQAQQDARETLRLKEREQEAGLQQAQIDQAQDLKKIEGEVYEEIKKGVGAQGEFADQQATAAAGMERVAQKVRDMIDDSKDVRTIIGGWVTGLDSVVTSVGWLIAHTPAAMIGNLLGQKTVESSYDAKFGQGAYKQITTNPREGAASPGGPTVAESMSDSNKWEALHPGASDHAEATTKAVEKEVPAVKEEVKKIPEVLKTELGAVKNAIIDLGKAPGSVEPKKPAAAAFQGLGGTPQTIGDTNFWVPRNGSGGGLYTGAPDQEPNFGAVNSRSSDKWVKQAGGSREAINRIEESSAGSSGGAFKKPEEKGVGKTSDEKTHELMQALLKVFTTA
jgi:hypothetical protein